MLKSIKYELNPTNGQKRMLNQAFGNCRFVYNWALNKKIEAYQEDKKTLSCFDLMKELTSFKKREGIIKGKGDMKEQVIIGQPPSKSNSYRIITISGHGSLAKTAKLKEYEKSFYLQCNKYRNKAISGFFELYLDAYMSSQRPDLDNIFKVVLDMLQSCNAIANDRNCVKIVAQKFVDKKEPRIEFTIKEV